MLEKGGKNDVWGDYEAWLQFKSAVECLLAIDEPRKSKSFIRRELAWQKATKNRSSDTTVHEPVEVDLSRLHLDGIGPQMTDVSPEEEAEFIGFGLAHTVKLRHKDVTCVRDPVTRKITVTPTAKITGKAGSE